MSDVTLILERASQGDPRAAEELLPLVYEELRRLASHRMAQQAAGQTLQATALVHEAWLKLAGSRKQQWDGRRHFFAAAAEAMRHILIDRALRKRRQRHGGGLERVALDAIEAGAPTNDDTLLALNEALEELQRLDPARAEVVKLRFFVGMSQREAAAVLGISERTVERHWAYAQAWLFERISPGNQP